MRTWKRAGGDCRCGNCGQIIHKGQPLLKLEAPEWKAAKRRCVGCSGEALDVILEHLKAADSKAARVQQATESASLRLTGAVQGELLGKGDD